MKSKLYTSFLLLTCYYINAQNHDFNNTQGESASPTDNPYGFVMSFETGYPVFSAENLRQSYTSYCIACSDSTGELLFHTNGRSLRNKQHQLIENGDTLTPGRYYSEFLTGYPSVTSGLALPAPQGQNLYYLIQTSLTDDISQAPFFPSIYYSLVDMAANDGKGRVLVKSEVLVTGEVPSPVAIKHGNGRDWWLIVGDYVDRNYKTFLIDPNGIQLVMEQGNTPQAFDNEPAYHIASPDGNYFVNNDAYDKLWIYDFDRCTGLLSQPRTLQYDPPPVDPNNYDYSTFYSSVNAFSADTRFLYLGTHLVIYQLDMQSLDAPEIALDTIGRLEYGSSPIPDNFYYITWFYMPELAPDDNIYVQTLRYNSGIHAILRPELPLLASSFTQQALVTPYPKYQTRCMFPAYRLGRALGAVCDTLPYRGPVEDRFRHTPLRVSDRGAGSEQTAVKELRLPAHIKRSTRPNGPYQRRGEYPGTPVYMARQALLRHSPVNIERKDEK
jgi:hypothetical protein